MIYRVRIVFLMVGVTLLLAACKRDELVSEPSGKPEVSSVIPEFYTTEGSWPEIREIAGFEESISNPKDLSFNRLPGRQNELWVLNYGSVSLGGSTVLITDPGKTGQRSVHLEDGNRWHFMALPTAIAFGDNGNWATSSAILDANRQGGSFSGPTLWPGDLSIYTKVGNPPTSALNGSHLDMIHQSPQSMGIAHWQDNRYFVFDGYHNNLTLYDFAEPHYPGGFDHSDGRVIHYPEVSLARSNDSYLPGHMELDEQKKWLYVVDTERKRVVRVDVNSGVFSASTSIPQMHNEVLARYGEMRGVSWELFASEGLSAPCGLAIRGNRVFVSDHDTRSIVCFDAETGSEISRIEVPAQELMGIDISPEGRIHYVDFGAGKVYQVVPR